MVSKITDKVMGGDTAWQNRMLDKMYPIVYMDAMHFKVKNDNRIVSKAAYICMDVLKGLPDAIKTVYPNVNVQTCIVHQIRNSLKYIALKDKKEFIKDLKLVYKASTEELALADLDNLKEKWDSKYGIVIESWYNNWDNLSTFFEFSPEIRNMIYNKCT